MSPGFGFLLVEDGSSRDDFFLMLQILAYYLIKVENFRAAVDQSKHYH